MHSRYIIAGAMAVTLALCSPAVQAGAIQIDGGRCSSEIRLVAREVRLSEVLTRLAETLDFQLYFRSTNDPLVTIDTVREPTDVVMQLTPSGNVSMMQSFDPKCNRGRRIRDVWVLNERITEQQQPPIAPQLSQSPEQARVEQEAVDMYYKAHGVDRTHH